MVSEKRDGQQPKYLHLDVLRSETKTTTSCNLLVDLSKAFDFIDRSKMEQILETYSIPNEIIKAIMTMYKNIQVFVRSPDGDAEFFDIIAGVLQGDTLAPYLFIIVLDYVLRNLDQNKNLGFTLRKQLSRR